MKTWDLERRIRRVYLRSSPADKEAGARWYKDAQLRCASLAQDYGFRAWQVAGVIAAISPGNSWELNMRQAEALLAWKSAGMPGPMPSVSTYSERNRAKARAIMNGEAPEWKRGPKVSAFYHLILTGGEADAVCVDGHAVNIAHGKRRPVSNRVKATEVARVREAYRRLAAKLGISASTLQATVWVAWRREGQ